MMSGDFQKRLKILNPKLKIFSDGNNGKLAGIYYIGWEPNLQEYGMWDICGIDKNFIPEYPEYDSKGHLIKSGWYRVCLMLETNGFTTKEKIKKAFGAGFYDSRRVKHFNEIVSNIRVVDEVDSLIKQKQLDRFNKTGSMRLEGIDALEIAAKLDERKTDEQREIRKEEKKALSKDPEKYVKAHREEAEKHGKSWTETSTQQEFEDEFFKK
jgi:hypothetical protein